MSLLVIGYGNELRGDDGVGPYVARAVGAWGRKGVAAVVVHQLVPELAEALSRAEVAVFVDAGPGAGECEVRPLTVSGGPAVGHALNPGWLLAAAREWYGRAPIAWMITVPAERLEHGEGLSARAARGAAAALSQIAALADARRAKG
jgi:hydrogenase maturation protease